MGIYISGMEMPKEGDLIVIRPDGKAYYVSANPQNAYEGKAVPVPPHGDLIDRDALCDGQVSNSPVVIHAVNAPAIIPASGGR